MSRAPFPALRLTGGLLSTDFIGRLADGALPGGAPADYGLGTRRTVREAASRAFEDLSTEWKALTRAESRGTRDWLRALFGSDGLGFGPLEELRGGLTVEDRTFKITHRWQHLPVHWLPWNTDLDHRTRGVAGAADAAPQSMLQELLNRSPEHLYALLANGPKLRLLRDSRALAGSAYVEFDLELIFDEGLFPDFLLLYRLLHASRFAGESATDCQLETWRTDAVHQGERARERLHVGVRSAIEHLGTGFARHPANRVLRERLADGGFKAAKYERALLRTVYRLLFWFVAEDRELLLHRDATPTARQRYDTYFSARRLRERSQRCCGDHHDDLWESVRLVFVALGSEDQRPELGLAGIGGVFERITRGPLDEPLVPSLPDELDEPLEGVRLSNEALLNTVRLLAFVDTGTGHRAVDFVHLDAEEVTSVYEELLEMQAAYDPGDLTFALTEAASNLRKTEGHYGTPSSLREALLDSALDPVLDDAVSSRHSTEGKVAALLEVTVCDPACGGGKFLAGAARRIARRVAQLRSGEHEPPPAVVQAAMREVVSRCIHGVDYSPRAVELTRTWLWLECMYSGFPLPCLKTNIRVGNSLLGTTPALLSRGIPDSAFKALTGDDKVVARSIARDNAAHNAGQFELFPDGALLAEQTRRLMHELPDQLEDVHNQLAEIETKRQAAKRTADAWCAAFVQEKIDRTRTVPITGSTLDWISEAPSDHPLVREVNRLTKEYQFFHWHLEFPHIFTVPTDSSKVDPATGWRGGFSCVLSNPPWERVKLQDKEFFAYRLPVVANAKNAAARKRMIAALPASEDNHERWVYTEYADELRKAEGWSHLLRETGRYPLTGRGDINTYAVFAETGRMLLSPRGQVGMVLPTGIATDATTQYFFKDLVQTRTLASIYDFENEKKIFPAVDHRVRFCLWTSSGRERSIGEISLAFRLRQPIEIQERRFTLTPGDITLLNPNTGTCPVFDHKRNAEITLAIYRHVGSVLWRETSEGNPWKISFQAMFHMANDSGLFYERDTLEQDGWTLRGNVFERGSDKMFPLYEAKMIHHFDHRFGTYEGQTEAQARMGTLQRPDIEQKDDPFQTSLPRYWVSAANVSSRLEMTPKCDFYLGWRETCRSTDERTLITSTAPHAGYNNKFLLARTEFSAGLLQANLSAIVADFCLRQKFSGTSLNYYLVKQLPILPPEAYRDSCPWDKSIKCQYWTLLRVIELSYSTHDMASFARNYGDAGPPFRWDEERRFWLRAELDAAYFHLYGVPHDDVDYIMDTFRAFRNNDPERFARTKQAILDIYDEMATAIATGEPYRTRLDPPPGRGPRHPAQSEVNGGG